MIVYISIGNSDDALSQKQWSQFWTEMAARVVSLGTTHGAWFSNPVGTHQNACWCVEFPGPAEHSEARETAVEIGASTSRTQSPGRSSRGRSSCDRVLPV